MTAFRRTIREDSDPSVGRPADGVTRLARIIGRLLLWGCVLLLLIRGAMSVLSTHARVPARTPGVTVTVSQPAHTETSQAPRR